MNSENSETSEPPKVEKNPEEQFCHVCGDSAKVKNYGVLTCEGCKKFFDRITRNKTTNYKCIFKDENCQINPLNRKQCIFCRLVKCYQVGMSEKFRSRPPTKQKISKKRQKMKEQKDSLKNQSNSETTTHQDFVDIGTDRSTDRFTDDFSEINPTFPTDQNFSMEEALKIVDL
ncbi:hypothetical protein B9Z55_008092 [Caenorhabditis nigoni]|uniref:Nuclear receptor domain-containing protein n=1 Tax=Caenorhabditis nigoni TaxID=1611254 RepID=A0A2G5VCN7_9PELO|nr:hypothetical protein B9Z55_008092 [Caenorhabditis nigoni]